MVTEVAGIPWDNLELVLLSGEAAFPVRVRMEAGPAARVRGSRNGPGLEDGRMTARIPTATVLVIALAASSLPMTAYAGPPPQKTRLQIRRDNYASSSANMTCTLIRSERRRFQVGLAAEGFGPAPADGLFGRGIRGAVRAWRGSRGKPARMLLAAGDRHEAESTGKQRSRNANVDRVDAANEILRDKYVLGLSKALKADDYPRALEFIDRLDKLGGDLPPAIDYFRGEAYFHTKRYIKADKALNRYLSKTGKKGRYYRKSLELLLTTEEKIRELPNEKDKHGNTALHRAARENDHEVVPKLIALGVDVNAKNKYGSTPLHIAADWNAGDVAALLIEAGADVNAKDKYGYTPLTKANRASIRVRTFSQGGVS